MTCSLVTMWPAVSITNPVPSASDVPPLPPPYGNCDPPELTLDVTTSTTPGEAFFATSPTVRGPLVFAVLDVPVVGDDAACVVTMRVVVAPRAPSP